ncbi:MAG: AAA family ATPase [Firmicutes bacterium]|nr:AAA family ATPase [Bacillota bacterium]
MEPRKRKGIPIGHEDFKEIVTKNCYFVDKTLLIQELFESGAKTTLLTRPRRFGKTLNLSMLRRFFEDERTERGEKIHNGHLFDGFAISKCGAEIMRHQGQYPVINLSLKSAKQPNYEMAYGCLLNEIIKEFQRHVYVLEMEMSQKNRETLERILLGKGRPEEYVTALMFLSECLAKYHGKNVFILIDEYDVPLENAYFENFYDKMIAFIRSLFESALKTNPYLEQGIITGCLRISRESVFTGLNNLAVHSMISPYYSDRFGFTEGEVRALLDYYGLLEKYPELQKWYDGYLFGETEIYNPWSILNYVKLAMADRTAFPRPYWSNTSSNGIIRELVENADEETKAELEALMDGGVIEKPVHEEITYGDVHASKDNLWNFLFFTGYLKAGKQRLEGSEIYLELSIPNTEIQSVYQRSIVTWFDQRIKRIDRSALIKALEEEDCETAENFLSQQLMDSISYFDYAEQYYHGFMTGLLSGAGNYSVSSNRESGTGRPNLILTERKFMGKAMVLELKIAKKFADMEAKCEESLAQMETRQYAQPLIDDGYRPILRYVICFFKKGCIVRKG